jgi:type II secretory pathway pseudopilin PulG
MTIPARQTSGGFTLLEAAVVAALFALLVAAFAARVRMLQQETERVVAEQLLGTLRTALQVRSTQARVNQGEGALIHLMDENPMGWLSGKPHNYLGDFYAPDIHEIPRGSWFFDRSDRSLVYLPNDLESFSIKTSKFLRFKVKFALGPGPADFNGPNKAAKGLVLDQVSDGMAVNTN